MSDNRDISSSGIEYLRTLSTDVIDDLIREVSLSDEIDEDFLDRLLSVAGEREPISDTQAAYEEFKRVYSGQQEIYPLGDTGNTPQTTNIEKPQNRRRSKGLRRVGIAAAVIVIIFTANLVSANALGFDFLRAIAKWTQDTFGFVSTGSDKLHDEDAAFGSLREALYEHGITVPLVPTWMPDGFTLLSLDVETTPNYTRFFTLYQAGDRTITIRILSMYEDSPLWKYEKDENQVSIYERNGIEHYIMTNNNNITAVWAYENHECTISGNILQEEIEAMIDSIYGG